MAFVDPLTTGRINTTASAVGLFLCRNVIHFASAAVVGRAPGSLED
jgi:hypothetical protein